MKFEEIIKNFPCTEKLRNIRKCGRAEVVAGSLSMREFTYLAEDGLHIAEGTDDGWKIRSAKELHESVLSFGAILGLSPLSRTRFLYMLPDDEAVYLAALMDLHGLAALREEARVKGNTLLTKEEIRKTVEEPEGTKKHTITDFIRIHRPGIKADPEKALPSLVSKNFCILKDGNYLLNDELLLISSALARPVASVLLYLTEKEEEHARLSSSFVLQGSILDNMAVSFKDGNMIFCSMSSVDLLKFIESTLSLREAKKAEKPVAGK